MQALDAARLEPLIGPERMTRFEASAIVNALQRHATIVVQKSLAEGFGLTVAEAMWKERPIVASAVGGIVDQIVHDEHGLLVNDPLDLAAFGAALDRLLRDPSEAARLGRNARERARTEFLGDRHLEQYGLLFERLRERSGRSWPSPSAREQ